jgi:hypothetical protein
VRTRLVLRAVISAGDTKKPLDIHEKMNSGTGRAFVTMHKFSFTFFTGATP